MSVDPFSFSTRALRDSKLSQTASLVSSHFSLSTFLSGLFIVSPKGHRSVSLLFRNVLLQVCRLKGHKPYSRIKHSKMPPDQNSVHVTPLTYCCMCSLKKETDEYGKENEDCNVSQYSIFVPN